MTNFSQYLRQLTQSMTKDDYVIVVDDFDNFKLVLKGDGRIAGNYHLSHLSTVDDIDQQKSTELDARVFFLQFQI